MSIHKDIFHAIEKIFWILLKPFFFSLDPEKAHHFVVGAMRIFSPIFYLRKSFYDFKINGKNHPSLEKEVFGIKFPNPVGLAAGFDKNAEIFKQMSSLGFGFIEIGTVTPVPQDGNPKKRIFRLVNDNAIINRLGFNNDGVDKIKDRLRNKGNIIIGGNIGKNKVTPNEKAKDDYLICFKALFDYVDYFAVNVSSPNTPNLRDLQNINDLREILSPLIKENKKRKSKPILIKISPDLIDDDIKDLVDMALDLKIDGIITSNTTIKRNNLKSKKKLTDESGGLSGQPLNNRSTDIIRLIHEYSNKKLPIIGVGGIMTTQDALDKINAGASLIQLYTGFIYNGPSFARNINKEIIKSLN